MASLRANFVVLLVASLLLSMGFAQAQKPVKVSYLTSFSTFGRDAYVYVADELGYFEEAGIDVEINPGSGTLDVMRLLAAGTADFGAGDAASAIIGIANQKLELQAVAAVHQKSLAAIVALESSGITGPADLAGRTFADAAASTNRILLPAYAAAAGFDMDSVKFVAAPPPDLPRLLASKQVDFIGQFVVGRTLIETAAGEPAVFLPYSDYLPNLYGIVTLARSEMIEKQPELVEAFVGALMRGLEYSIDNPQEAAEILARRAAGQKAEIAASEIEIMAPFVRPADFEEPVGSLDPEKLQGMIDLLDQAGVLENEVTVDDIYAPGFVGQE